MPVRLVVNGVGYNYPVSGDENWAENATNWAVAVTQNLNTLNAAFASINAGVFSLADGAVGSPSLRFTNSPTTGLYRVSSGVLGFTTNGVKAGQISGAQAWSFGPVAGGVTHSFSGDLTVSEDLSVTGALAAGAAAVASLVSSGAISGTSGTFSGAVSGTTGTFSGPVSGTTGTFSGAVGVASLTSSGDVSGTTGTFTGAVGVASLVSSGDVSGTTGTFSADVTGANLSGTNTGDQTITLTGNVAGSGTGSFATTIASGVVVNSMISAAAAIAITKIAAGTANQLIGANAGATANEYKSLAVGTSGTDFAIAYAANSITFNLPDASAANRGVVTTGTQTITGVKTFSGQLIGKGTATNDNAAAGIIGEYIESVITSFASAGANNVYQDVTSISLTAGDWDITGNVVFNLNTGTGFAAAAAAISINSGNITSDQVEGSNDISITPPVSGLNSTGVVASYRLSLSSTTTVYLKGLCSYGGGTPRIKGTIRARRRR